MKILLLTLCLFFNYSYGTESTFYNEYNYGETFDKDSAYSIDYDYYPYEETELSPQTPINTPEYITPQYEYYVENPKIENPPLFDQLPYKEQDLITLSLLKYQVESQKNILYFSPALNDLQNEIAYLNLQMDTLATLTAPTPMDYTTMNSLAKVLVEKEQMVSNIKKLKERNEIFLNLELREQIQTTVNDWLQLELKIQNNILTELIQEVGMRINAKNSFYK